MADDAAYVEVQVETVGRLAPDHWVVQLLDGGGRKLQITIGQCEAMAIFQRKMADFEPKRPLTQDLAIALWRRLGGELVQLRIDDLFEGIYYSKLTVNQDGEAIDIDCRPSDGLALALTANVPIYIADTVMRRGQPDNREDRADTLDDMLRGLHRDEDDEGDDFPDLPDISDIEDEDDDEAQP